jgi:hypothetical protein
VASAGVAELQAGNLIEAERFFQRVLDWEEAPGIFPYRHFYDSGDLRHMSSSPWPGLRKLKWPTPESVLPGGTATALQAQYSQITTEARAAAPELATQPGAFPGITSGTQWTKLVLYSAAKGWDPKLCAVMPTVCELLRGKLRTEQPEVRALYQRDGSMLTMSGNDEEVVLFRVKAQGMATLHQGQDPRVNVHLCLLNCNQSKILVAGEVMNYHDSAFFAFEDRADHEIINMDADQDRINLAIGVLHPDYRPNQEEHLAPHRLFHYVLGNIADPAATTMPGTILGPTLVLASYYLDVAVVKRLLDVGASPNAMAFGGLAAVHAVVMGVRDTGMRGVIDPSSVERVTRAKEILSTLARHGANLSAKSRQGTPRDIAAMTGNALDLKRHLVELISSSKGGRREGKGRRKRQKDKMDL